MSVENPEVGRFTKKIKQRRKKQTRNIKVRSDERAREKEKERGAPSGKEHEHTLV